MAPMINPLHLQNLLIAKSSNMYFFSRGIEKIWHAVFWVFSSIREFFSRASGKEETRLANRVFFLAHSFPRNTLLYEMVHEAQNLYPKEINSFYRACGKKAYQRSNIFWRYWINSFWAYAPFSYSFMGRDALLKQGNEEMFSPLLEFYRKRLDFLQKGKKPVFASFGRPEIECMATQMINALFLAYFSYRFYPLLSEKIQCTWKI